jgi:hypothetical protein
LEDFSKLTSVTILKIEQTLSIPVVLIVQVALFFCFIKMFNTTLPLFHFRILNGSGILLSMSDKETQSSSG